MPDAGAEAWIRRLDLRPHPEGGFYRESYRAAESIARPGLPSRYGGDRSFSTAIYFLLQSGRPSRFHRLRSDEIWHFYDGAPLLLHVLKPGGAYERISLGRGPEGAGTFQAVLFAGWWFGAEVSEAGSFSLVGCTIAPGFEFQDFELGRREDLLAAFPDSRAIIERLTSD